MTPTIALKGRLDRAMKQEAVSRHWNVARGEIRRKNIKNADSRTLLLSHRHYRHESENDVAKLLLSVSNIVTNEIKNNSHAFDDEGDFCTGGDASSFSHARHQENSLLTPRETSQSPTECNERFKWSRARTVSIDSPLHNCLLTPKVSNEKSLESFRLALGRPALISPMSTPIGRGRPVRRASLKLAETSKQEHLKVPKLPQMAPVTVDVKEYKKKALKNCLAQGLKMQTIGRKKFSWKNYPGTFYSSAGNQLTRYHSLTLFVCTHYRVRSLLDCESRRIPAPFCVELHGATEALQQSTHRAAARTCFRTWLCVR
jgi:hypothetical protein